MRGAIATLLLVVAAFVLGAVAQAQISQPNPPPDVHSVSVSGVDCPTEDSCQIDYSHGKWTVTEVQP